MDCLADAIAVVESFCQEQGVALADALRLSLIVEELFTNTVSHGYRGDSDAPIRIALRANVTELELWYEDAAPPFDPLEHVRRSSVDLAGDAPDRPVGRLGIALVTSMAARVRYERDDGWNRVVLALLRT